MQADDYEYRGLIAASWDLLRGDTSQFPDIDFYREFIEAEGQPALIVGCGTGRLLLDYAAAGLDVEGIDVSPEMVALCREKAAAAGMETAVHVQAMQALDLPRTFRTIIVPSSGFQLVPDLAEARAALAAFHQHMLPGGALVMSSWQITDPGDGGWSNWYHVAEANGFGDGQTVRRWERSRFDPATKLRYTENRYELLREGEVEATEHHHRAPELRSYAPAELVGELQAAGFSDVRAVSGFSHEPAAADDEVFCVIGRRPTFGG